MVVISRLIKPTNPAFIGLIVLAAVFDSVFAYIAVPTLGKFTGNASKVTAYSDDFGLLGIIGFNFLPIILLSVYLRRDFRNQKIEAFLLALAIIIILTPLILRVPIMYGWATINGYHTTQITAADRALAGSRYSFER